MDKKPFNSQAPHFMQHVHAYCAKVLPLVFDNSLSYYEFLCKMCHKLNESIDAINAQNLNIIEFTKMLQLEIEKFEAYVDNRMTNFESEMKTAWEGFKTTLNTEWEKFRNELDAEWAAEKKLNETFRNAMLDSFNVFKTEIQNEIERFESDMLTQWETYKTEVTAKIAAFEESVNSDMTEFKQTMQNQHDEFEKHMVALFTQFTENETKTREGFQSNFEQLFEQWKINTLAAIENNISGWETDTKQELTNTLNLLFANYETTFNSKFTEIERNITLENEARTQAVANLQNQIDEMNAAPNILNFAGDDTAHRSISIVNSYCYRFNSNGNFVDEGYCTGSPPQLTTMENGYILMTAPINELLQGSINLNIYRGEGATTGTLYVTDTLSKYLDVSQLTKLADFEIPTSTTLDTPVTISNLPSETVGYLVLYTTHTCTMLRNSILTRAKTCYITDAVNNEILLPYTDNTPNSAATEFEVVSEFRFILDSSSPTIKDIGMVVDHYNKYTDYSNAVLVQEVNSTGDYNNEIAAANPRLYFYSREQSNTKMRMGVMVAMSSPLTTGTCELVLKILAHTRVGWSGIISKWMVEVN